MAESSPQRSASTPASAGAPMEHGMRSHTGQDRACLGNVAVMDFVVQTLTGEDSYEGDARYARTTVC